MKTYVVDTNVFLRFLLRDNEQLYGETKEFFAQAQAGKVSLILVPQVIFEIDYVLRGVYSLTRKESAKMLASLVKSSELEVENRSLLINVVEKYNFLNIDLFDIYLWAIAKFQKAKVLSFDNDFKRIK